MKMDIQFAITLTFYIEISNIISYASKQYKVLSINQYELLEANVTTYDNIHSLIILIGKRLCERL